MLQNDPRRGETGSAAITRAVTIPTYDVAGAPDATEHAGRLIAVSDGDTGDPCLAFSDGTDWLVVSLGSAISDGA